MYVMLYLLKELGLHYLLSLKKDRYPGYLALLKTPKV